jgi:hypothetical protein
MYYLSGFIVLRGKHNAAGKNLSRAVRFFISLKKDILDIPEDCPSITIGMNDDTPSSV